MQRGGDAYHHDLLQHQPCDAQRFHFQPDGALRPHKGDDRQHGGDALGDDGGVGHALHAHVELEDEQQIQHRVQHRRHQQEVERPPRVAYRPQYTGAHVVDQQPHHTGKVDGEVRPLFRHYLCRRFHEAHHGGDHGDTGEGEHHA